MTSESGEPLQRKEPKKNEFKSQGELETGYKEESWEKPENMEEEAVGSPTFKERKVPDKSEFKAPGELEAGYTERSWTKPIDMEGRVIIEPGEKKEEFPREAGEKVKEESRKAQEEARGEKRTAYTMKKRLTKSKKERMLFGVCGGLGEYFGIDPTFMRLAFAALALQGGIGIALYIILAILMPSGEGYKMISSSGQ
ncbi:transcriptional regulator [Methanosarcina spelaei]|uniref:Transcriptional regulator n=2 Tax=Methanosarcina spelaei TaxID=1036679 RepID=A0A2A2HTG0_9EURY|nr:transcriptional regulator [Methanosarcina spelaei]